MSAVEKPTIEVGATVRSISHPELGPMKVLYVQPADEVYPGGTALVTVSFGDNEMDDTELEDLVLA